MQDVVEIAADDVPHVKPGSGQAADIGAAGSTPMATSSAVADPSSDPPAQPPNAAKRKGPWHRRTTR